MTRFFPLKFCCVVFAALLTLQRETVHGSMLSFLMSHEVVSEILQTTEDLQIEALYLPASGRTLLSNVIGSQSIPLPAWNSVPPCSKRRIDLVRNWRTRHVQPIRLRLCRLNL